MAKFTTIDLSRHFNADRTNQPLRPGEEPPWQAEIVKPLQELPAGAQTYWGIPFALGPAEGKSWLVLDTEPHTIEVGARADYLVVLHFCGASQDPQAPGVPFSAITRPGEHLADYVLVYEDGSEHCQPIRRRFEVGQAVGVWGQLAFAALPHQEDIALDHNGPYPARQWGRYQTGVGRANEGWASYWLYALPNPHPEKTIASLRLEPTGAERLALAALTLYEGEAHPLRRQRLESLRLTLPEAVRLQDLPVSIDLGSIARKYAVPSFVPEEWLNQPLQGWGEEPLPLEPTGQVLLDVTASADATLTVADQAVPVGQVLQAGAATSNDGRLRVELLTPRKAWVHVTIEDAGTGQPTPARVHFRAGDGRYLPPYGHRHEVNDNWFEDYGADLKLGHTQYAYVDGRFQIELPVGDVYVEVCKGFEYRPLRQKLTITPGQRELKLRLERPINQRARGWVTADTHVHFISPQTAWLEAQGEGVNLVNLLASQWGDLFTNVGDITGTPSGVSQNDTIVWVGTENRQHLLGHMSLLGAKGSPVYPMCASGPSESYLGDPVWSSLAEWADRCRRQEGLVVIPHFPNPYCEVVADLVLDKVDGVEIRYFDYTLDNFQMREWYRFLNCGYRVAAVGGTDKMWAGMPVGGVRTYADLAGEEFTFANWAKAVRAGRTFTSSGPIIGLSVEGKAPGDEIRLRSGGGTLAVEAWAESVLPFHALQIVANGRVVASEECQEGCGRLAVAINLPVSASSWIAARCVSRHKVWHGWPIHVAAHTSPVYVNVGGLRQFSPSDATYMMTLLDGGMTWLDTLSIPADAERQAKIRRVFQEAKEALHQRLHAAGQGHSH
ncbi:MAG: CehA/McbA family metallohydrolase [Anaerolineae bacterium]